MLYRVLSSLCLPCDTRIPAGVVSPLKKVTASGRKALLKKGVLVEVHAPPLQALPGWEKLAEVFLKHGIEDAAQLVCADLEELSKKLNVPVEKLEACVDEVLGYIS